MRKLTIKIKRPEGNIEDVDVTRKFMAMNDALFAKVKDATREGGHGEVLSWEETFEDDRTEAEKAYDDVSRAIAEAEAAETSSYYSPERIIRARQKADRAKKEWAAKFPEAAAEKAAKSAAEKEAEQARIRESDGYKAKMEGRD